MYGTNHNAAAAEQSEIRAWLKPFTSKLADMKGDLSTYILRHLDFAVRQLNFLNHPHRD